MIYELKETSKVADLFKGWQETMIYSCLDSTMGKIFVNDIIHPQSAMAYVGCFAFLAGKANPELLINKQEGYTIFIPQSSEWENCILTTFPNARSHIRYAIKKDTKFNIETLNRYIQKLPMEYLIQPIDSELYDLCLKDQQTRDFVSSFSSKEEYLHLGRGIVITKNGKIVAGASSYSRYKEGIEIEVDTIEEERRKGLATIASAQLILNCLKEGLYPSWDAVNMNSVKLAMKLGYEFSHEYICYIVK